MSTAVRPSSSTSSARSTSDSVARSRLEVASSRISTRGDARNARASAMSWRSPDDRVTPRSWHGVSSPSGSDVDELEDADRLARGEHVLTRGFGLGELDVVADAAREQERLLGHDAELAPQRVERDVGDVVAVDEHPPVERVVEAREQLGDGRLARAGGTDQRERLALRDREVDVLEHERVGRVPERHVLERDLALDRRQLAVRRASPAPTGWWRTARGASSTPAPPCWYVL